MSRAVRLFLRNCCGAAICLAAVQSFGAVVVVSNTNAISINDSNTPPTIATPYPSTITVTGLTGQVITDITVTLRNLNHEFPSDIDMILMGPQGQMAVLMSQVGGSQPLAITNITITLDDSANPLPIEDPLFSGTFRPTARHSPMPFDFPPPVPAGNSNTVAALSVFKNTDPTGIWKLFVVDDASGDLGELSGGWTLTLEVAVPLKVAPQPSKVVVSWPASAPGLTLQSSTDSSSFGNWTNVLPGASLFQGNWVVTNSVTGAGKFYRLVGP